MGTTSVDPTALLAAALRIDDAADLLQAAAHEYLGALQFEGAPDLRAALDRLAGGVPRWSRAARELAAALRVGAEQHSAADLHGAAVIR